MNTVSRKIKLRYLWLDSRGHIRNKLKIVEDFEVDPAGIDHVPQWSFDGSSTGQAVTSDSDLFLNPVRMYVNTRKDEHLILCTVTNFDGEYIASEKRPALETLTKKYEDSGWLFGIEQEYVLMNGAGSQLYRWPENAFPDEQGPYYCGVGYNEAYGTYIVAEHTDECINYDIAICGTNAEVMPSQWEFQIGTKDPLKVADDLIVARYLLYFIAAKYEATATLHPKPVKGNWNGSGAHTNFSTKAMMDKETGPKAIEAAIKNLSKTHNQCIALYGKDIEHRMTGEFETSDINTFSWGDSDRASSIRKPIEVRKRGYGYLEDRRPCANINPYTVCAAIIQSVEEGRCTIGDPIAVLSDDGKVATINGVEYERSDAVDEQYLKGVEHATEQFNSGGTVVEIVNDRGMLLVNILPSDLKLKKGEIGRYRIVRMEGKNGIDKW